MNLDSKAYEECCFVWLDDRIIQHKEELGILLKTYLCKTRFVHRWNATTLVFPHLQTCLKRIRLDLPILHEDFTANEGMLCCQFGA